MDRYSRLLKFEPCSVTKPWGVVHRQVRRATGIELGVGEFWLASAQVGEGNYSNPVSDEAFALLGHEIRALTQSTSAATLFCSLIASGSR